MCHDGDRTGPAHPPDKVPLLGHKLAAAGQESVPWAHVGRPKSSPLPEAGVG